MSRSTLKAAILVVSTTASLDASTDASETALRRVFEEDGGGQWSVADVKIVPDSTSQIQGHIVTWANEDINLIVTTGGTGFAVQDNTPEAVSQLLHRHAPGLVHGMLAASLEVTPCKSPSSNRAGGHSGFGRRCAVAIC